MNQHGAIIAQIREEYSRRYADGTKCLEDGPRTRSGSIRFLKPIRRGSPSYFTRYCEIANMLKIVASIYKLLFFC